MKILQKVKDQELRRIRVTRDGLLIQELKRIMRFQNVKQERNLDSLLKKIGLSAIPTPRKEIKMDIQLLRKIKMTKDGVQYHQIIRIMKIQTAQRERILDLSLMKNGRIAILLQRKDILLLKKTKMMKDGLQ